MALRFDNISFKQFKTTNQSSSCILLIPFSSTKASCCLAHKWTSKSIEIMRFSDTSQLAARLVWAVTLLALWFGFVFLVSKDLLILGGQQSWAGEPDGCVFHGTMLTDLNLVVNVHVELDFLLAPKGFEL